MMPPRGGEARAESLATLTRISHEMFVDDETGRLLEGAASELNGADPDGDDARLIALVRRQWDKARRVSPELAAELARAASVGQEAWIVAREQSDFKSFAPYLEHNFELARRYVECHAPAASSSVPMTSCSTTTSPSCPRARCRLCSPSSRPSSCR